MARQDEPLANLVWHALTSKHAKFAIGDERARRYRKDVAPIGAVEANDVDAFDDLAEIYEVDELAMVIGTELPIGKQWEVMGNFAVIQMLYEGPAIHSPPHRAIRELTDDDVPAMLELIAITQPGPFLPRTIELGPYLSIWQDGRLAAMAGVRMYLPGYHEISAVCAHPDYQRNGFARQLVTALIHYIQSEGDRPFLHVVPKNLGAIALYEQLGFKTRFEAIVTSLRRKQVSE